MGKHIAMGLLLMALSTVPTGCGSAPGVSADQQAATTPENVNSTVLHFLREEKGRSQSLDLRKREGGGFDAAISVSGDCLRSETGSAKIIRSRGDPEVEVDPDGEGHPTDSFVLTTRTKCRIEIRLAAPERDYAWIRESECATDCPLTTKAMTRE